MEFDPLSKERVREKKNIVNRIGTEICVKIIPI